MLAAAHSTLEECERADITDEARTALRMALYGSDTTYNFGKVKLEFVSDTLTCMGPKCYFATDRAADKEERRVTSVKMKGCQSRNRLDVDELTALGERKALLRERAPRIKRSAFGVGATTSSCAQVHPMPSFSDAPRVFGEDPGNVQVAGAETVVRRRAPELPPPPLGRRMPPRVVRGNRAALLRAGVPRKEADDAAGGDLYKDYLPAPGAARPREMIVKMHSPSTFGLDFFLMGKKKGPKDYEGFLMLLQPLSYFIATAKIRSRSSRVSERAPGREATLTHPLSVLHSRLRSRQEARRGEVRKDSAPGDRPGHQVGAPRASFPPPLTRATARSYLKTFQKHIEASGARQRREWNFNKISVTERMGGLFKRHLATLAREKKLPWYDVLAEAEAVWNSTYVSKLGVEPPDHYGAHNFDELLRALHEKEPMEEHAQYPVGRSFTEQQLAESFKFRPGDRVRVSLRTVSKRIAGPVSGLL